MICSCLYSAGVGRTGTLIAIDMALTLAPTQGTVDIPQLLTNLRKQRMKMVQTVVRCREDFRLIEGVRLKFT